MKTINGINYYTKQEIADLIGCCFATISVRISQLQLKGRYMGKFKYFNEEELQRIVEYKKPTEK